MSGVNQHYLPQFLMRGFATKGGTERSPVYKAVEHHKFRGVMAARNIRSIGAQRNFYGKEGPGSIDDAIDRLESTLAPLICKLNLSEPLTEEDIPQIASLAAHLVVRAKHMRSLLENGFREMGGLMRSYAKDGHLFERGAQRIDDAELEQMIAEEAGKRRVTLTSVQTRVFKNLARAEIQRKKSDPVFKKQLSEIIVGAADRFDQEAGERSEQTHLKALGKGLDPAPRVAVFQRLQWSVIHFPGETLILPDVPIVAFSADGEGMSAVMHKDEPSALVALPISTNRALIGSSIEGWQPTADDINRVGAEFAHEFFIAERANDATRALAATIGSAPAIFDDPEWTRAKQEALEGRGWATD
ncbi:MAG: DUF4238 domain-containing protein [Rhodanobacter sp.]